MPNIKKSLVTEWHIVSQMSHHNNSSLRTTVLTFHTLRETVHFYRYYEDRF